MATRPRPPALPADRLRRPALLAARPPAPLVARRPVPVVDPEARPRVPPPTATARRAAMTVVIGLIAEIVEIEATDRSDPPARR